MGHEQGGGAILLNEEVSADYHMEVDASTKDPRAYMKVGTSTKGKLAGNRESFSLYK